MKTWIERETPETRKIVRLLIKHFADVTAYRYNSASIRIRVIDSKFEGLTRSEREELVMPLLEKLPEETQADITILLLLAPNEAKESMMNVEFEYPSPTSL